MTIEWKNSVFSMFYFINIATCLAFVSHDQTVTGTSLIYHHFNVSDVKKTIKIRSLDGQLSP